MSDKNIAFTAPHWAASQAGIEILKEGGTATEAMVAAAAVISVVYPHMNSIGGDGFWLIDNLSEKTPIAIDACGRSASNIDVYNAMSQIPSRGGLSALAQAGTVRGWQQALTCDKHAKLPLTRILEPAITWARSGFTVSESLQAGCEKLAGEKDTNQAFKSLYLNSNNQGKPLQAGDKYVNAKLANTFEYLAMHGLDAFYHGELADSFAQDLAAAGSPLTREDLANTQADIVTPLILPINGATCYNLPAPTQGVHSLQILGVLDKLKQQHTITTEADWMHLIVEATKQSFNQRNTLWGDKTVVVSNKYDNALSDDTLKLLASGVDIKQAKSWPFNAEPGDTVWMGAKDKYGQLVSFIQSVYWEFGSGVAMSEGGFAWNNRGLSFSLQDTDINVLAANKKPAHTLNPAMAKFDDGRRLSYGTMGGEGQPQTQAVIFSGYAWRNKSIEQAIADPRWLLGRTWGEDSSNLKVEKNLADQVCDELNNRGHDWYCVDDNNEMMGHAGAILETSTKLDAATDPRSDGRAIVETSI